MQIHIPGYANLSSRGGSVATPAIEVHDLSGTTREYHDSSPAI